MPWPFRRRRDLDEEIQSHLAMAERDRIARGESADEARRAVRREFGNVDLVKDVTREVSGLAMFDTLMGDARHAFRRLRHRPMTSVAVVSMLGLAIGVATAMFAIADSLLLRPVPFRHPDRLARVYMGTDHGGNSAVSSAVLRAWRDASAFDGAEGFGASARSVVTNDGASVIRAVVAATPGLFQMLGVSPIRGRLLEPADAGTDRILIAEDIWRGVLASDAHVIGRTLDVDGRRAEIVGVLPAGVRFPDWNTQIWRALDVSGSTARSAVVLRIAEGIQRADALAMATDRAHAADPSTAKLYARAAPVAGGYSSYYGQAVRFLTGAVVLVFVVLCANVCSLLLARFGARRIEFTLCAALGASRWRLMRQVFAESAMLAGAGALVGIGLAWTLITIAGTELPQAFLSQTLHPLRVEPRTVIVAVVSAAVATLAAGLVPAVLATRLAPTSSVTLKERGGTESRGARLVTRSLLVGQIALACTLLVGTALLVRSFLNFIDADRGFDPHGLVAVQIEPDRTLAPDATSRRAAVSAAAEALQGLPGVSRVALSRGGPMTDASDLYFGGWVPDDGRIVSDPPNVEGSYVSPEFFEMYGIPLVNGRLFEAADTSAVVVIGTRLAAAFWPDVNPIGRGLVIGKTRVRVVGVVGETNRPSLENRDWADLFMPLGPTSVPSTITLRCGDRCPGEAIIRERVRASSAAARVWTVTVLEQAYADDAAQPRATAVVASLFGVIALIVSAAGLFAVLSAAVARRRREFGIRAALGSSQSQLRRVVLLDAARVAVLGVVAGGTAAWFLARLLSSLQYGVTPHDPVSWSVVAALLAAVTILAAWLPARDAMRADPATLLREE